MNKRTIALIFVLLVAAFLRLYRLETFTEFLGDQGRTGSIIWNAWNNKIFPLVGPPVLSGQYLGPFFYYFIAFPFLLSHFNPLAPALWMAMFGILSVFLVFFLGEKLFGSWIGLAIAALYAVSPYIISSDRTLWEPNIIPFFVLLYIFLIYIIYQRRFFIAFLPLGVVVGILVQLHYPNVFFVMLSFFFLLFLLVTKKKQETLSSILVSSLLGVAGFLLVLSPFLYYEYNHGWKDFKEILLIIVPSGSTLDKQAFLHSLFDFSFRLFYRVFPIVKSQIMAIVTLVIIGTAFVRRNFWGIFFGLWFVFGVAAMSLYKGIVFDHYLNFLMPLPFFLFGVGIYVYKKYIPSFFWIILIVLIAVSQLRNSDVWKEGQNDIVRTKSFSSEMIRRASGESFSFTLISSRSFSDLHYRYFFLTQDIHPASIVSTSYRNLFLICEKAPCRSVEEMEKIRSVRAICYEDHCSGEYPTISLDEWQLVTVYDVLDSRMYIYRRKPLLSV